MVCPASITQIRYFKAEIWVQFRSSHLFKAFNSLKKTYLSWNFISFFMNRSSKFIAGSLTPESESVCRVSPCLVEEVSSPIVYILFSLFYSLLTHFFFSFFFYLYLIFFFSFLLNFFSAALY